jgi:radical SAM protein with 4Fe4S-binding SPASM domain
MLKESDIVLESAAAPILFALSSGTKRRFPCSISGQEIMGSVSIDGRISLCAQYWGADIFESQFDKQSEIRWIWKRPENCSLCIAKNICGGPCFINFKKTGKTDRERCRFFKRIITKLLENPQMYLNDEQIEKYDFLHFPGKEEA